MGRRRRLKKLPAVIQASASDACTAVGYEVTAPPSRTYPVAEEWDGTNWSLETISTGSGTGQAVLLGISCPLSTVCVAVGAYGTGGPPLAATWNAATWSLVHAAHPTGQTIAQLEGDSCTAPTVCEALPIAYNSPFDTHIPESQRHGVGRRASGMA